MKRDCRFPVLLKSVLLGFDGASDIVGDAI